MTQSVRVLVADDDEGDARLTLSALRAAGVDEQVRVVPDGRDAMDYLYCRGPFAERAALHPALVLLDLKMPRADGFRFLEMAKGDPALRVVPVVVLTSSRHESDLVRAYALGANGYVVKPMDYDEYVASLGAVTRFWLQVNEVPPSCVGRARP